MTPEQKGLTLLSEGEIVKLGEALSLGLARPITEAELERVVQWASQARCDSAMLTLVLSGVLVMGFKDGDIAFTERRVVVA